MWKKFLRLALLLAGMSSLALAACASGSPTPTEAPAAGPTTPVSAPSDQTVAIRITALPILDKLPMLVADQEGLFARHGVKVQFIDVQSAPERDQLISAEQADGMINEAVSTMFYNKQAVQVQIVRYARAAAPGAPLFSLLASAKSGITSVAGLKGVEIGVSQGTVIEYTTERILAAEGLQAGEIKTIAVPKIGDRMALLGSGELKAGVLPEPLATLAASQGAKLVIDDTSHPEYSFSVIAFRKAFIDAHPEAIRGFLAAVEEATQMINAEPNRWRPVLSNAKILPQPLAESFQVPPFVTAGVPTEAQWQDSLAWAQAKGLIETDLPYADSVNPTFLPAAP